jgi:hypothetical protein
MVPRQAIVAPPKAAVRVPLAADMPIVPRTVNMTSMINSKGIEDSILFLMRLGTYKK